MPGKTLNTREASETLPGMTLNNRETSETLPGKTLNNRWRLGECTNPTIPDLASELCNTL